MTTIEAKKLENELKKEGYKRYNQKHHDSTFQYFKNFGDYLIGFLFYDCRNYEIIKYHDFGITTICILDCDKRIELMYGYEGETIYEFEGVANDFYQTMKKYETNL